MDATKKVKWKCVNWKPILCNIQEYFVFVLKVPHLFEEKADLMLLPVLLAVLGMAVQGKQQWASRWGIKEDEKFMC